MSSQMLLHDDHDSLKYKYLLRIILICPRHMHINIEDIHSSGKEMSGKFCCLLAAVRCVKFTKLIKTKIGKKAFLKEIIVMDKTYPTLVVRIWDKELSERAAQWLPKKTILSFSNLFLKWNVFKRSMTAVVSNKTIITEDSITNEANDLKNYANTHLTGLSTKLNINIPDLSTITDIMTCKRVLVKSNEIRRQLTAILYAIVSKFNIDGLSPLVLTKWQVILLF
ncbi:protein hold'em-like [Metopolophium dirhodum]|uniref:protein hold'em-like n=1 Tax=Metopolophium dirhodum TaxID=44670 RepID=UPI00298FB0A7|nr:protein hold'em-like [Metopolophium dirhodum]